MTAASLIFFAYIGFDAISTSSEEVKEPKRDLPSAIIGSLVIATVLYILVAIVATGALPFDQLAGEDAPLAAALSDGAGLDWAREHDLLRRARRDHQRRADDPLRPDAHPLRDVPRRPDAARLCEGQPAQPRTPVRIIGDLSAS